MMKKNIFLLIVSFITLTAIAKEIYPSDRIQKAFFRDLLPYVQSANQQIMIQRRELLSLRKIYLKNKQLNPSQKAWLEQLAAQYHTQASNWLQLMRRVDIIPASLALGQADKETAGGTTRFARYANNYFGMWCYSKGCGMIPRARPIGASYQVKIFPNIQTNVNAYMHNLNTNPAYLIFRSLRQEMRMAHLPLNGYYLAQGLLSYSTTRYQYVHDVCGLMHIPFHSAR